MKLVVLPILKNRGLLIKIKMQEIFSFGRKIVSSHKYSSGTSAILEMTETMYAVVVFDNKGWLLTSRNFPFTESCKKEVLKECKTFYKFTKDCLSKKTLDLLEGE